MYFVENKRLLLPHPYQQISLLKTGELGPQRIWPWARSGFSHRNIFVMFQRANTASLDTIKQKLCSWRSSRPLESEPGVVSGRLGLLCPGPKDCCYPSPSWEPSILAQILIHHTHTDAYRKRHTQTDTQRHRHTHRDTHTDTHRYTHTQTHTDTHTDTHRHTHTQRHRHTHRYTHIDTHT